MTSVRSAITQYRMTLARSWNPYYDDVARVAEQDSVSLSSREGGVGATVNVDGNAVDMCRDVPHMYMPAASNQFPFFCCYSISSFCPLGSLLVLFSFTTLVSLL
jgi:hypothetical protein